MRCYVGYSRDGWAETLKTCTADPQDASTPLRLLLADERTKDEIKELCQGAKHAGKTSIGARPAVVAARLDAPSLRPQRLSPTYVEVLQCALPCFGVPV